MICLRSLRANALMPFGDLVGIHATACVIMLGGSRPLDHSLQQLQAPKCVKYVNDIVSVGGSERGEAFGEVEECGCGYTALS